jgi:hypothetical protein
MPLLRLVLEQLVGLDQHQRIRPPYRRVW